MSKRVKKNGNKSSLEKIILVTVIIQLVQAIIELIKKLLE